METKIIGCIDRHQKELIDFAEDIYRHPEEGFCEFRTASKVKNALESLGLKVRFGLARTGVRGVLPKTAGPHLTVIGELDGILCPRHPLADKETGVAHACGHHVQLAVMLGAAMALTDPAVRETALAGRFLFWPCQRRNMWMQRKEDGFSRRASALPELEKES